MAYKIGDAIGNPHIPLEYMKSDDVVDNNTLVGVEIEVENINYRDSRDQGVHGIRTDLFAMWNYHEDGSLRNGSEFTFKTPYSGVNLVNALKLFDSFVHEWDNKYYQSKISLSDRCSVHVHVDVRNMNDLDIINLVCWYLFVERILFRYVDITRYKNSYCKPLVNSNFIVNLRFAIENVKRVYSDLGLSRNKEYDFLRGMIREMANKSDKYSSLNLMPMTTFGSIEFRHHDGTKSGDKILKWVNIILALKKWSSENDFSSFSLKNLNRELVEKIFSGTEITKIHIEDDDIISGRNDAFQFISFDYLKNHLFDSGLIEEVSPSTRPTFLWRYKKINGLLPLGTQQKVDRKLKVKEYLGEI